jgi:Ca2+-binding RTX toxin-like protein
VEVWSTNGPDRSDMASVALYDGVKIVGSNRNDKVDADRAPPGEPLPTDRGDLILGNSGNDKLSGLGGNDWINGGEDRDKLIGGAGNDCFVFDQRVTKHNSDKIMDLELGFDKILLDSKIFTAFETGQLSSEHFQANGNADVTSYKITYDKNSGKLYYGNGDKKDQDDVFAIVDKKLDLDADSFFVI